MKVCIPVEADHGMRSPVCHHFGAAPFFLVVETERREFHCLPNANQHHEHGRCSPLATIASEAVDTVIVGGIGPGAINGLRAAGIRVFRTTDDTVEQALESWQKGALVEVDPSMACASHGHGHSEPHR